MTVAVDGLPLHTPGRQAGEIVLSGLPFQGRILMGKDILLAGEVLDRLGDWTRRLLPSRRINLS